MREKFQLDIKSLALSRTNHSMGTISYQSRTLGPVPSLNLVDSRVKPKVAGPEGLPVTKGADLRIGANTRL